MKKTGVFILAFLLIIPFSTAIETNLKQEYKPGETLIAEISGNFLEPIKASDILFYSGRLYTPLIYDISKIENKYYLYAILPNKQRNYTLIIKNAGYFEAGEEKRGDLKFNFQAKGNISLFSVNPGFIITNKDFAIKVRSNLETLSLTADFLNSTKQININAGQTKTIDFSISGVNKFSLETLTISSGNTKYEIPVAIFPNEISEEKIELSQNLRFSKSSFNFTVTEDQEYGFEIPLINTGQENIENINLTLEGLENIAVIQPKKIPLLFLGSMEKINLTIISNKEGLVTGNIKAISGNYTAETFITIRTVADKDELENLTTGDEFSTEFSCSDLNGEICKENQECDGIEKLTLDGWCCIGNCKEKNESDTGKYIAILTIILILGAIGFFVYKKMKARKESGKQILKKKSKEYEERFKPKEIRGSLTRT